MFGPFGVWCSRDYSCSSGLEPPADGQRISTGQTMLSLSLIIIIIIIIIITIIIIIIIIIIVIICYY